jgi:hypothetical protein
MNESIDRKSAVSSTVNDPEMRVPMGVRWVVLLAVLVFANLTAVAFAFESTRKMAAKPTRSSEDICRRRYGCVYGRYQHRVAFIPRAYRVDFIMEMINVFSGFNISGVTPMFKSMGLPSQSFKSSSWRPGQEKTGLNSSIGIISCL